ncbi:MAG: head decoration protein [Gammaproteobacteria bacterium]|nr:head decoration protein [Gammaproteobacteria bacterium]
MTTIYEDDAPLSEGVKYELRQAYTRDSVQIASGSGVLKLLTVLGKVTASKKYKPLAPEASDGSQTAAGIATITVDAGAADAAGQAIVRGPAIVNPNKLIWPNGITAPQKDAAMAALLTAGIKAGTGV